MMVGIQETGDVRYGPVPSGMGTQAGTDSTCALPPLRQSASRLLSHPHPGPMGAPVTDRYGFAVPTNPSRLAATSSRCAPQLGMGSISNVAWEIANRLASALRLGIWAGRYQR